MGFRMAGRNLHGPYRIFTSFEQTARNNQRAAEPTSRAARDVRCVDPDEAILYVRVLQYPIERAAAAEKKGNEVVAPVIEDVGRLRDAQSVFVHVVPADVSPQIRFGGH